MNVYHIMPNTYFERSLWELAGRNPLRPGSDAGWSKSYTKLLAFNLTEYDRVLQMDSDATVLQTMDELFLAPSSPVAISLAYWTNPRKGLFTPAVMLVEPSAAAFNRTMDSIPSANSITFDMEIMNNMYKDTALTIPHRLYTLLAEEFRSKKHRAYLGNSREKWDAEKIFKEAKYLHFSDWPVPKPWIKALPGLIEASQPPCELNPATGYKDDCRVKNLWLGIYEDFRIRRENICDTAARYGSYHRGLL